MGGYTMQIYNVTLREVVATYGYEIDAESEQEACEKAAKLMMSGQKGTDEDRSFYIDASASAAVDLSDMWAQGKSGTVYHITEGGGENLSEEDIEEGYIDYIYYDSYEPDGREKDGGIWLLRKPYRELSMEEILGTFDEEEMTIIEHKEE